jgi:hypothetical protein
MGHPQSWWGKGCLIRIMYFWPEGGELTPVLPLLRMGRGIMMGVDHNRNLEWVGGSAALWV